MKRKNSFTILEVVFSIFILSVGAFASFSLIQQSLVATSLNESKLTAYYLAQEQLEIIRNIRDNNWLLRRTDAEVSWNDGLTDSCLIPRISPCDFYGDVNFDGIVTDEGDAALISKFIAGQVQFNENQRERADVNDDGNINASDITAIQSYTSCLPDYTLPVCSSKAKFQREVNITSEDADKIKISASINWQERQRNYNIEVVDYLYNWR